MSQWVIVPAVKADDLCLFARTTIVEKASSAKMASALHMYAMVHMCLTTQTFTHVHTTLITYNTLF